MLQIENLSFAYSDRDGSVLREVNLSMDSGDLLGLLGPNGAGKTTLVSLITGILQPGNGSIRIAGERARLGRRDVALVPQEYAFYERLTGRENLNYFAGLLEPAGARTRAAVNAALAACELQDVADRKAGTYSGGLKRRLNFAVALLQEPRLLILDEPTAGVDPHSRSFLLDVVRRQNRRGVAVIYTSHLLDEVQSLCNRVAVMDRGRIVMAGAMDELLAANARRLTVFLDRPLIDEHVKQLGALAVEGRSVQFDLQLAGVSPATQLGRLEQLGYGIRQIHYSGRRLEELFFELTHRELRD